MLGFAKVKNGIPARWNNLEATKKKLLSKLSENYEAANNSTSRVGSSSFSSSSSSFHRKRGYLAGAPLLPARGLPAHGLQHQQGAAGRINLS